MSRKNLKFKVKDYIYDEIHYNMHKSPLEKIENYIFKLTKNKRLIDTKRQNNEVKRISNNLSTFKEKEKAINNVYTNNRQINIKIRKTDLFNVEKLRKELTFVEKMKEEFPNIRRSTFSIWKKYKILKNINPYAQ